jgi:PDZ domain-containing protein
VCLFAVRMPYATLQPGSALPVNARITVKGATAYPSKGTVLFTTVSIRDNVNLLRYFEAKHDSTVHLIREDQLTGGRSVSENRQLNLDLMKTSKDTAAEVALRKLGFEIKAHGALITDVEPNTDAATKLQPGDVITAVDGTPIEFTRDLRAATATHKPGDVIRLHIDPSAGGKPARDVDITLRDANDGSHRAIIGISPADYNVELPVDVGIDTGAIGGPSAGLAFTLATIDVLTPGELTGGAPVAVTGTIDSEGNVGPVGGVTQKTAAVKRAGSKVFLVPSAEYDEARKAAGKDLRVIRVDTLDQALSALASLGGNALALPSPGGGPTS